MPDRFITIAIIMLVVLFFAAAVIFIGWLLRKLRETKGEEQTTKGNGSGFELSSENTQLPPGFVARTILFFVFETVILLLIPWIAGIKKFSWSGLIVAGIVMLCVLLGFGYALKKGDMEWD